MTDWRRIARFLFLGGCAAGVNWLSRFAWDMILPFAVAVIAAYITGMVVAFVLFRRFVFPEAAAPMQTQVRNFVLVNLVGMALTWGLSLLFVTWLFPAIGFSFYPREIGHGLAIAAPTVTSWFGHRYLTFREA